MLQNCNHLDECESILSERLSDAVLLGEANLLPKDVRILRNMFNNVLSSDFAKGTAFIRAHYPCSLASFLVATGTYGYKDDDFWSAVENAVGKLGPRFRGEWGNFFLNFIHEKKKPHFDIDKKQAVAAILGHGGVPDSCLENYFEEVILPLLSRDISHGKEAIFELSLLRENNECWEAVRQNIQKLEQKEAAIHVKIAGIREQVFKLARYREKYPLVEGIREQEGLPGSFDEFKKTMDEELAGIQEAKKQLTAKKDALKDKVNSFSKNDQILIDHAEDLVASIKEYQKLKKTLRGFYKLQKEEEKLYQELETQADSLLKDGWDPEYGDALHRVDIFELEHRVADLKALIPQKEQMEGEVSGVKSMRRGKGVGLAVLSLSLILAGLAFPSLAGAISTSLGFVGMGSWFFLTRIQGTRLSRGADTQRTKYMEELKKFRDSMQGLPIKMDLLEKSPLDYLNRLEALKDLFEQYCMRREHVRELKRHITEQERTIREAAVGYAGGVPVTLDDSLPVLMQSLSRARAKKTASEKARKELEKINQTLRSNTGRQEAIYREMENAVRKIEALGGGDYIRGLELLDEGRRAAEQVARLEKELGIQGPGEASEQRKGLILRYKKAKRQLALCRKLLAKGEKEFSRCGPSFPVSVEEPVQKFLLYGGEGAAAFLANSLTAARDMVEWGRVSENSQLPERVKVFLQWWWEKKRQEEADFQSSLLRKGLPYLALSEAGEVKVGLPPQVIELPEGSGPVSIRVKNGCSFSHPVSCRFLGDGWVETMPVDFKLPSMEPVMPLALVAGEQVLGFWELQGAHPYKPYLAFDEGGRQIMAEVLPRKRLRLLLCEGYTPEAGKGFLGEQPLPGYGQTTLCNLDLANISGSELAIARGEEMKLIPLEDKKTPRPQLRGGQILAGARLEDRELYTAPPLALRLPLLSEKDAEDWSLSIIKLDAPEDGGCHFQLKDIMYITDIQEGVAEVPLIHEKLLGRTPCGLYSLRARHTRFREELFQIAVLSGASVDFSQGIYAPCEEISHAAAVLTLPGIHDLQVMPPVEMERIGSDTFRLFTLVEEEFLLARVETEKGLKQLYLKLDIPKLRWRLRGKGMEDYAPWQQECGELWYGDLDKAEEAWIEFCLPHASGGSLTVVLKSPLGEEAQKVNKGHCNLDLKGFLSTHKLSSDEQLLSVNLVRGKKKLMLSDVPVLKVTNSWEVSDLTVHHESADNGIVHLSVRWNEKGKADKKNIRLWKFQNPWTPLMEKNLETDQREFTLRVDRKILSPGNYLVEVSQGDAEPLENPFSHAYDVKFHKVFEIKRQDPYVKQWQAKRKGAPSVLLSGKLKNVNRRRVNLEALFLGLQDGEAVLQRAKIGLVDKKSFKKRITFKNQAAHWLVLVVKESGEILNWSAHLIPGGDDLTWPLERWKSKMLAGPILKHCQIKLASLADIPFASLLSEAKSREVIELAEGKRTCVKLEMSDNGTKNLKLVRQEDGRFVFEYEKGVQCMTCGEKIANQDMWNKSHYPKCKSLIPHIVHSDVKATLIWPGGNMVKKLPGGLRFGKELVNEVLTLYTDRSTNVGKVMEELIREGKNLKEAAQALFSKEKQVFKDLDRWIEAKE